MHATVAGHPSKMPMEDRQGVLHQTTLQTATGQTKPYRTTTLAGNKRSFSDVLPQRHRPTGSAPNTEFQRASSLSRTAPKLIASAITITENGQRGLPGISEYSQRNKIAATSTSAFDTSLLLSHPRYALPAAVVKNFASLGINEIYHWQKHCLMGPGLLEGTKNLVYTAPTGGGKSLVADVLMLKRVLEHQNAKALLVLPYVALVQEKVRWLRKVVQGIPRKDSWTEESDAEPKLWRRRADENTIRVIGFFGGGKIRAAWADFDIAVCTFEKVRVAAACYQGMETDELRPILSSIQPLTIVPSQNLKQSFLTSCT